MRLNSGSCCEFSATNPYVISQNYKPTIPTHFPLSPSVCKTCDMEAIEATCVDYVKVIIG